ncbi:hypothetical protein [Xanthomonas phage vB_XooS_NR08]|nr:hypothetical protein [Xanthomonas phage vB_XooS_NR08]
MASPKFKDVDKLLKFDWKTGQLTWRVDMPGGIKADDVAGKSTASGYVRVDICGRVYPANKIVWLLMREEWSTQQLQHIDANNANHHFSNLRIAGDV